MRLHTCAAPPPLSNFVDMFWFCEGYAPRHAKERILPTGTIELVVNLRDERMRVYDRDHIDRHQSFRGSVVCGAQSRYFVIDTAQQESVIGVHFKPGGAFPFLRVPASELRDQHVSLDTLWGAAAADLRERLLEAATPGAKFRLLAQALLRQSARPLERRSAVEYALREFRRMPHMHTLASLTERISLSSRRFVQVFDEEVGLTPKLFCRILRFQKVLDLIAQGRRAGWADVALACGYFDQAHFVHDFRAFSGVNPSAYLAQRTEHRNHLPL